MSIMDVIMHTFDFYRYNLSFKIKKKNLCYVVNYLCSIFYLLEKVLENYKF